ncbi:MAG: hypothetical protein M1820_010766 [Bogoriella megaspora]|nr:MAG: hypothetical protein M1820_010766 [Bogoriella megaspora]
MPNSYSLSQCDELRPTCGHCRRLGDECSFDALAPDPLSGASNEQLFTIDDMRLLHKCLQDEPLFGDQDAAAARQDQNSLMQLAFAHPYVLHTKLSLTALDLFHHDPANVKYYRQASAHNLAALRYARPNISRGSKEHSEAIWTFSALTSLYAFVEPPLRLLSSEYASTVDPIQDLLNAFWMGRGINTVMALNEEHLKKAGKPDHSKWPDDRVLVRNTVESEYVQLGQLKELVSRCCNPNEASILHKALQDLFETIALLDKKPLNDSSARLIQTWPMHLDASILAMMEARNPLALVVVAHYAVMVNQRRNIWFF